MSEENGKEETSITTHTRKRNLISGIDDAHLAMGAAGIALAAVGYVIGKPMIDNFIQNMSMARQQQAPPPPPVVNNNVPAAPPLAEPLNEYVEEPVPNPNTELAEVDHKNYQTTRKRQNNGSNQSPFGASIARG
jgi:hypothetical protein